eukprot:gnl/TRDRNA2_/TRDRNA2_82366_c0_seq1.p1 gnl/TRDRNA2_/TRDRNA2_82366_c0~~gnl/TRDRNA2_/TRDRNA2_82366_c0_seq1.p1  ORF type:complete len:571 (+),score=131.67 gnl/TRDRNA2_/TRDRNA2_82366_c0_seq1:42-1754(+)
MEDDYVFAGTGSRTPSGGSQGADSDPVVVPRGLLREVIEDGCCPLHLRMALVRAVLQQPVSLPLRPTTHAALSCTADEDSRLSPSSMATLVPCMSVIAAHLPLAEVLALRAASSQGLQWAMQRSAAEHGELRKVHNRIRARLWICRVSDLTDGTSDETIFESQVRSFADDALRRRMEGEMAGAKLHMERQIRAFQQEVDQRMEEQAVRLHAIVEERVQQRLDLILAQEMEKLRNLIEEQVQERVRSVVQQEVRSKLCEVQGRLYALARENDRLRDECAEHSDVCLRTLVWALSPKAKGPFACTFRMVWKFQRRFAQLTAWLLGVPADRRLERARAFAEAANRLPSSEEPQNIAALPLPIDAEASILPGDPSHAIAVVRSGTSIADTAEGEDASGSREVNGAVRTFHGTGLLPFREVDDDENSSEWSSEGDSEQDLEETSTTHLLEESGDAISSEAELCLAKSAEASDPVANGDADLETMSELTEGSGREDGEDPELDEMFSVASEDDWLEQLDIYEDARSEQCEAEETTKDLDAAEATSTECVAAAAFVVHHVVSRILLRSCAQQDGLTF